MTRLFPNDTHPVSGFKPKIAVDPVVLRPLTAFRWHWLSNGSNSPERRCKAAQSHAGNQPWSGLWADGGFSNG